MERTRRLLLDSSGELSHSTDIEYLLNAPLHPSHKLHVDTRPKFHPVPTVGVSFLLLLIQVAFVALTCVAVYFCIFKGEEEICKQYIAPFSLSTTVVIAKVLMWLLHLVNERFIQYHHCRAKGRGYLKLYWSVRHLKSVPLVTLSTGNAAVLLILSAKDSMGLKHLDLYLILGVLLLELLLSVIFLLIYAVKICSFNRSKPRPDIIEEEHIHSYKGYILPGIGFRERSSLEDVIEKQGDTIEYLKRHNAALSQKILALIPQDS